MISIIIPTINRFEFLDAALGSVAAQSMPNEIEVIVVNDGGPSVAPVVRAWENVFTVKLAELDRQVGPAAARNIGIDLAVGKYIAFLDDDDLFLPEHLAAGCKLLELAEADFVYLGAIVADHRLSGLPHCHTDYLRKAYPFNYRFLLVANFIHTGSVITRNFRHAPVRFDEALEVCEDWDIWIALTDTLGYRVSFVDQIATIYHQVPNGGGLVARGQLSSPSKFEVARDYIYAKWPSPDPLVLAYRQWMIAFEQFRSYLIARKVPMPNLLFDQVLGYVHKQITEEKEPVYADIRLFFDLGNASADEFEEATHCQNILETNRDNRIDVGVGQELQTDAVID